MKAGNFIKKWLRHRCFFCEFCEIFKGIYFWEHLQTAAFVFQIEMEKHGIEELFKGATKLNSMPFSCVVIILFNAGLNNSAFSAYFFTEVFRLSVFYFFCLLCFEFEVIDFLDNICVIIVYIGTKYSVILFSQNSF